MPIGDKVSKSTSPEDRTRLTSTPSITAQAPFAATPGVLHTLVGQANSPLQSARHPMMAQDMLSLQRSMGNRTIARLLQRTPNSPPTIDAPSTHLQLDALPPAPGRQIQRKVAVGPANDPFEREADQAAKQVTRALQGGDPLASKASGNPQGITSIQASAPRFPKVTRATAQRRIQRKVFFEIDELQKKDVANLEITKVNMADRPAFVKSRWKYLDKTTGKGKTQDYRHIVSFDLIKKAFGRVLKSKTVDEAAVWLADAKHWIDQNYVHKDILPLEMLKSVQGAQAAAENWLKNANSFEDNLWRGPCEENREKGMRMAQTKGKIREKWANTKPVAEFGGIADVVALDKTSDSRLPFEDDQGLQFVDLKDYMSRFNPLMLKVRITNSGVVLRAIAGSTLHISMKDKSELRAPAIYIVGNDVFRVGRSFEIDDTASIPDKHPTDKVERLTKSIPKTRQKFIESQIDPTPKGITATHDGARDSLMMYDGLDMPRTVVDIALTGTKYAIQKARMEPDAAHANAVDGTVADGTVANPRLESDIQRASGGGAPLADGVRGPMEQAFGTNFGQVRVHADANADRLNRSVNAKAFTTGRDIFFRQGYYKPGNSSGRELLAHELAHVVQQSGGAKGGAEGEQTLQRKVHFELREKTKLNVQPQQNIQDPSFRKWKIKHVEISGRPPILKSRQNKRTVKGQDYRHIVSFTLIAKALRKVLKGMTIDEAANWLNDNENWIDQDNVHNDKLDPRFMGSIQGIQAAADNWLKNANSFKGNLWPGPSKENRQKGGEAAGARKKLGKTWLGPEVVKTVAGRLLSLSSSGELMPFEDNNGNRYPGTIQLASIPDGTILKAMMGATFTVIRQDEDNLPAGSTVYVTGGAMHKVGRNFQGPKAVDSVRDTHLNAQIDHPSGPSGARIAINSLAIRDKNRNRLPVVALALGQKPGKYLSQSLHAQITKPIVTKEEIEVQKEAEHRKQEMVDFVLKCVQSQHHDMKVFKTLAYPPRDIERFFLDAVIPNCKVASDVNGYLKKTWLVLDNASTAAETMMKIVAYVRHNGTGNDDEVLDKWRKVLCGLARNNQVHQTQELWQEVEKTFPQQYKNFQSSPSNSRPNQSYSLPQNSLRSSIDSSQPRDDRRDSFSRDKREDRRTFSRRDSYSSRDDRQSSLRSSTDQQPQSPTHSQTHSPTQSKKRSTDTREPYKSNQSDDRRLKGFQSPSTSKSTSGIKQSSRQSFSQFNGSFSGQNLSQDSNPFVINPPSHSTGDLSTHEQPMELSSGSNPLSQLGNTGQLGNLLSLLQNFQQSNLQQLNLQQLNLPSMNLPPTQPFSFNLPPQFNQSQSQSQPQGFNFLPPQQSSPLIGRYVNIINGFNVVGMGRVLEDHGLTVVVAVKWNNGFMENLTYPKNSPNLQLI